jgi:hypothetical protein
MQDVHDNSRNFKSLKQYATSVVESYKHASSDSVFSEAVVRAKDVVLGRFA